MTRKRRYEQAFSDHEAEKPSAVDEDTARAEKEQQVWDAIKEAHYEAIDQLPLTLTRQLALMRQLDDQTMACTERIVPTLEKYVYLRQEISGFSLPEGVAGDSQDMQRKPSLQPPNDDALPKAPISTAPLQRLRNAAPPHFTSLVSRKIKQKSISRELLHQVASLTEEMLHAAQEKVNLAQTNVESVDRYIVLIDQAIREQEKALDQTQSAASIHLPELVIPQWRPNRRPEPELDEDEWHDDPIGQPEVNGIEGQQSIQSKQNGKGGRKDAGHDSAALTITLPPTQLNEPLYCYCNRVSFGEMIACDNESCEREWFHLGCVGLLEPPEGEWFCEDCKADEA